MTTPVPDFHTTCFGGRVSIGIWRYTLALRSAFGTSHSSTTSRTNALITVIADGVQGFGEVGLPPKKPGCYFADYDDVLQYVKAFCPTLEQTEEKSVGDVFADVPGRFLTAARESIAAQKPFALLLARILSVLDAFPGNANDTSLPARFGIECAVLDCWSKHLQTPLYRLLSLEKSVRHSFVTVAMHEDVEKMMDAARFSLQYSSCLKVKLDADVDRAARILQRLQEVCVASGKQFKWSLDANAAWSLDTFARMLQVLEPFASHIYMIEQPFPLGFPQCCSEQDRAEWIRLKDECLRRNIRVFADESVCNYQDVLTLKPYVHGVNIKLEKAGGLRAALHAAQTAADNDQLVWLGVMVGSGLNSNANAQLLQLCVYCDVDGALLVTPESSYFDGGFTWEEDGIHLQESIGLGLTPTLDLSLPSGK